jgi:hypothetical protein
MWENWLAKILSKFVWLPDVLMFFQLIKDKIGRDKFSEDHILPTSTKHQPKSYNQKQGPQHEP